MDFIYYTNKKSLVFRITIQTRAEQKIRVHVSDFFLKQTIYANKSKMIKGERNFFLRFPVMPDSILVSIFNDNIGNLPIGVDRTFSVTQIKKLPYDN